MVVLKTLFNKTHINATISAITLIQVQKIEENFTKKLFQPFVLGSIVAKVIVVLKKLYLTGII